MTPIQAEALTLVKFHGNVKSAVEHLINLDNVADELIEALSYLRINVAQQLRYYPAGIRVKDADDGKYLYTQHGRLFNLETGMESYPIYPLEIYKL
tara:strand:+ start:1972 stop:2259 length:288 start_codon:yes stop_codon:yes gene_type:complete